MILEGIITTVSPDGDLNIAPMGPEFDPASDQFELRPFDDSATYRNLSATSSGVLHVTDDVLLIARSAINQLVDPPKMFAAEKINGQVLADCCRWFEFKCKEIPTDQSRKTLNCQILHRGRLRDFFGFNRAKHAILEATIAVTRIDFLPAEVISEKLTAAEDIVSRTGGSDEKLACELLGKYVLSKVADEE